MKPVYVWWDSEFDDRFKAPLVESIDHSLRLVANPQVNIFGSYSLGAGDYESADWYFDDCFDNGRGQVNAQKLMYHCIEEPWQEQSPHIEIIGTSKPLWAGEENNNFVHGLSIPGFGMIVSYYNVLSRYDLDSARLIFSNMAVHEQGHVLGVPDDQGSRRSNLDMSLGAHCPLRDCVMGQVDVANRPNSLQAAVNVRNRYNRTGSYFCPECLGEAADNSTMRHFGYRLAG